MASIRVTPEILDSQGQDLIGYAGDLTEILQMIDGKINEIMEGWDGLAEKAYYEMYTTMKTSLEKFPELVNNLGTATVSSAEAYSSLDEQLQSGFKSAQ